MSAHAATAHDHGHEHDGSHSPKHYVRIWMVLLVLLVVSVLGPELGIPAVTLVTAFGIAFVKAWLVIKHFMHMDAELPFVRYVLVTSLLFMLMFFAAVSVDVLNHDGARWTNVAAKSAIAAGLEAGAHAADHGAAAGDHAAPAEAGAPAAGH